jgi:putative ABC transport system permease protein
MLKNYWLVAIRKILRHKIYSSIDILGLTIGVASCLIIFLVTRFELSYDTFHPDKDRIYRVVALRGHEMNKMGFLPSSVPITLQGELIGCEAVTGFYNYNATVTIPGHEPKHFDAAERGTPSAIVFAQPQYFDIFKYRWLAGNPTTSLSEPNRVVLTQNEMHYYFGDISPDAAIGRQIIYNDSLNTFVSGVVASWTGNTDFGFKDFISFATVQNNFLKNIFSFGQWGNWTRASQGFVKLAKGVTPAQIERQFPDFEKKYTPPDQKVQLHLQPLADLHFNADYTDAYSRKAHLPTLYGLMAIAVFILLLAAINFINLSTAQSFQRTKEIGIRKVLGSRRRDIAWQFLGETFLLTLLAVGLSIALTPLILSLLHDYLPPGIHMDYSPATLLFLLGIAVITALLAGSYPAKVISALLPVLSLKGQATRNLGPNRHLHRALIVFQFTISLVFIMGTVIVTRQLHYVLNKDLGFDKDAIITFRTRGNYPPHDREVLAQKLRALSGITLVSLHNETPEAQRHNGTDVDYAANPDHKLIASYETCDTNYLRLFGIKLVAGRNVFPNDSVHEFLLNETCARQLGFTHPSEALGQTIQTGMDDLSGPIVGIVRDFHAQSLHEPIQPFFILDFRNMERTISIKLGPGARTPESVAVILNKVKALWKTTFPNEKFSYSFFDESIANLYQQEQKISVLMRLAMVIAILISCMGLLGLASFAAEQRSKEISIRKLLGASVAQIMALLTGNFLWPVALAFVIATPVAWYFMKSWLQGFVYRTTLPWWLFGCCGAAAVAIALLTVGFQAVRTAMINPANNLRNE